MTLWNVRVWCLTASYNYKAEAPDEDTAKRIVKARVMPDMIHWHFSTRLADKDDIGSNDDNN